MKDSAPLTILCLASHEKGNDFLREAKKLGCHLFLLTAEKYAGWEWARESLDELFYLPTLSKADDVLHAVSYLAREHRIDLIIALDDFDVERAAALREHLRLPGVGDSAARFFRDKLAMRLRAREAGILQPEFTPTWTYDDLREWMARVPPPWVLKPRSEAASAGIHKLHDSEALWRLLDQLGDRQSFFVLEQYIAGDVCHVDSIIWKGEIRFAEAHEYAVPPLTVTHHGGIFSSHTLARDSELAIQLREQTRKVLAALGQVRGVAHTEFIRAHADGRLYFLETAARVGGANIAEMVEAATGVNLWREWALTEVAHARGESYQAPEPRQDYAGLVICLARQEAPDTSGYQDREIVWRMKKANHAGLLVASDDRARVRALLDEYQQRFAEDFMMTLPPPETMME